MIVAEGLWGELLTKVDDEYLSHTLSLSPSPLPPPPPPPARPFSAWRCWKDLFTKSAVNRRMQHPNTFLLKTSFQLLDAQHVFKGVLCLWYTKPRVLHSNSGKFPVQNMLLVKTPNCQTEFAQRLTVVHLAAAMHVADQYGCSPSLPRFTGMWCKMCCFWWFDVVFGVGCCCGGGGEE